MGFRIREADTLALKQERRHPETNLPRVVNIKTEKIGEILDKIIESGS